MEGNSMELNIQRFADGGAEGASSGENAAVAQPQTTGENAGNNTADNASVAGEQTAGQTQIDLSSFTEEQTEELIDKNPNLKKVFGKRMEHSFGKRLAQERAKMQESMKPVNDLIDELMIQHDVNSVEELSKKLKPIVREEYAIRNGVTNETGNKLFNIQLNNLQNERARKEYEIQQKIDRQMNQWEQEASQVRNLYPNFDLKAELENPDFGKLLQRGIPMEHVYKVLHMDDIVEAAKKETAAAYAKSTAQMQARPTENGLGNQVAVNGSMDVSKLTKKERAELAKRAQRGETITF